MEPMERALVTELPEGPRWTDEAGQEPHDWSYNRPRVSAVPPGLEGILLAFPGLRPGLVSGSSLSGL
jgi:hypothetical protein